MTASGKKALLALGLLAGTGAVAALVYSMASDEKKKEAALPPSNPAPPPPAPSPGGGNNSSSYPFNPFNPYGTGYDLGKKILGKG